MNFGYIYWVDISYGDIYMRRLLGHIPLKYFAPALAVIAILLITPQVLRNTQPEAVATATPRVADIGQTITFDASQSKRSIVDYKWIFHDETKMHGKTVQHTLSSLRIYYVTLIVTAGNGLTDKEEYNIGIDPMSNDTDNDGLSDYEGATIWVTSPKIWDSISEKNKLYNLLRYTTTEAYFRENLASLQEIITYEYHNETLYKVGGLSILFVPYRYQLVRYWTYYWGPSPQKYGIYNETSFNKRYHWLRIIDLCTQTRGFIGWIEVPVI